MISINIHEAKAHLSHYLSLVEAGEEITLCRRNVPFAKISAIEKPVKKQRSIGLCTPKFDVPDSAFAPIDEDDELYKMFDESDIFPKDKE